ncbi:MAG: ABC transporter ATP-binding protein [Tissierellia bacterium]|nr:ABC transporter ATP-binding protein [Tissierellia bacterium]
MFEVFKKLRWFNEDYRINRLISISFMIISYALVLIPPWMIGFIVDNLNENKMSLDVFYRYMLFLFGSVFLLYIINYIWMYFLFKGSDDIGKASRRLIVKKILGQGPIFFEKNTTGSIMAKATNDVRALQDFSGYGMMALIDATIFPIASIAIMSITISLKLTIAAIIPLFFVVFITKKIGDKVYNLFSKVLKSFDSLNENVLENVSGVRVIRAFVREDEESKRFSKKTDKYYKDNMEQVKYSSLIPGVTKLFPGISFVISFAVGAYLIKTGEISTGKMVSFVVYLNMLIWPMYALGEYINIAEQASAAMDRIAELLGYKEDINSSEDKEFKDEYKEISFVDFDFKYPTQNLNAVANINLVLSRGKTLGIVGKIGSGKTTLLKQLLRFYPIEAGKIFIDDEALEDFNEQSIRDKIGYVPQQNILFSKTIRENILFGKSDATDEEIYKAINAADFKKDLDRLPKGLETLVGEKGVALSGGQKQRISIARALIKDPEILILDDSLSAVDANTEENIIKNIKRERKGKTNIIAAHRLSGIMHADEIIVLENGRIVERGNHEELLKKGGWYKEQFMIQQLEDADGR